VRCRDRHLRNFSSQETGCGIAEEEEEEEKEEPLVFNYSPPVSEAPALLGKQRGMKP